MNRLLCFLCILLPGAAEAKRAPAPEVKSVLDTSVRYSAPNDDGRRAYIKATDAKSGKLLWAATIFRNPIDQKLEEDVQWVFIKSLKLTGSILTAEDERNRVWELNLKTRAVSPLAAPADVGEKPRSRFVSQSPDAKFQIMVEAPLPVTTLDDGIRWVGESDGLPDAVQFVNALTGKVLGTVESHAGGPVSAEWRGDSGFVVLTWQGYRYNWYNCLVRLGNGGRPEVVELKDKRLREILRRDTRAQKEKGDADYPFEKKQWYFYPGGWTKEGNLVVGAIELAREPSPHPFQQGVTWYEVEAEIDKNGFRPVKLTTTDGIHIWRAK